MCASCGKLMGVGDACPYCGADNKKVALRLKRVAAGGAVKSAHPVTTALVIVNVFLFLVALGVGGMRPTSGIFDFGAPNVEFAYRLGLMYQPAVAAGDWWRLITPIFLHLGVLHLFFNSYILWVAGRHLESEIGSRLMLMVYLGTGILGFVASYATGTILSGGASGAISGLLGFLIVRRRLVDGDFRNPLTMWIIQLIVLTAIFGVVVSRVDNAAHLGGFVSGALVALLLTKVRMGKGGALGLMLVTTGLVVATGVAAAQMGLSLTRGSSADVDGVTTCMVHASNAFDKEGLYVDQGKVGDLIDCFGTTASLGGEAAGARDEVIGQLKVAKDAHEHADAAAAQDASRRVREGVQRYRKWLDAHWALFFPPPARIVSTPIAPPLRPEAEASPMHEGQREP